MNYQKTLILSRKDVECLIDLKKSINAVESAFKAYGLKRIEMPSKVYLDISRYKGDFRAMPAYIEPINAAALKWVNVHTGNAKYKLPTVMAVLILSDPKTGFPLSIMDGTVLTSVRTAAAGALAAKYLAKKESANIGLVGCGEQAKTQLEGLRRLFKIRQVKVWGHKIDLSRRFVRSMKIHNEQINSVQSVKECVMDADIIVTTTPSRKPLVKLNWLKPGVHINAIGADAQGKIELDPLILKEGKVVIDDWLQASHSGEINVALSKKIITKRDIYGLLAEIVIKKKEGRVNNKEITVFDSTGLAIQDVAVAKLIYQSAVKKNKGRWVKFV